MTITVADNSDTLTLKSTDADANSGPNLFMHRDSGSPADGDSIGKISFVGDNDAGETTRYARIDNQISDASDGTEDGMMFITTMIGGSEKSRITLQPTVSVFNEESADIDFRVESDNDASAFFLQGSDGSVGFGTNSPAFTEAQQAGDFVTMYGQGTNGSILELASNKNTNNDTVGIVSFVNTENANDAAGTRRYIAQIRGKVLTDDTNGGDDSGGNLVFQTKPNGGAIADRFIIMDAGHIVIGGNDQAGNLQGSDSELVLANNTNFYTISNNDRTTNSSERQTFRSAGTQVGAISAGGSSTSYGTSSDYRLKENVDYTWDATTRLKQLKPARFNWIADDTNTLVDGFIAHEAAEVVPESVFGTKDGMAITSRYTENDVETQGDSPSKSVGDVKTYSSSEIQPQQIDQAKLVPLLVKTIQELEARITALEA
jgi:hypothetical protein